MVIEGNISVYHKKSLFWGLYEKGPQLQKAILVCIIERVCSGGYIRKDPSQRRQ